MLLVALAAVALYLPALGYPFVYDSLMQVHYDTYLHQPGHWFDVLTLRVLGRDVLDNNRPANLASLMADALLWGRNPAGFRLTNLLLHGAAAALLLRWLSLFTGGRLWPAVLAALLFAAHPLHTETVVEVGYREDLLVTCFLLVGLNAAAAFRPGEKGGTWGPALLTVASLFLAAASKEAGAAGPVALATYWLLFRRGKGESFRAWAALAGAATAAVALFFALRFALEPKPSLVFAVPPQPIAADGIDWLLIQARIWSAEFLRIAWPAHLCPDYGPYTLKGMDQTWALLGLFSLAAAMVAIACWNRTAALGTALFWAALLPTANLVPIYRPMADRYLYLPLTGAALLLATALAGLTRQPRAAKAAGVAAGAAVLILAAGTVRQERLWSDRETLWKAAEAENPASLNVWMGQGDAALEDRDDPARALPFYRRAVELSRGGAPQAWIGIALAEDALGHHARAAEALERATKLDSRYANPDTLLRAVALPAFQVQTLTRIRLRAQHPDL